LKYADFLTQSAFTKEDLIAFSNGTLIDDAPGEIGQLPTPPMLMFDRIVEIRHDGDRGFIAAEQDVALDAWYFWCHFRGDPVQPGCLGVDAIWQLIGFYITIRGLPGAGRALGCKEVDFRGQIRPFDKVVRYEVDIVRVTSFGNAGLAIGNGRVLVDGITIYTVNAARVGTFLGIRYGDYPRQSANSRGGIATKQR